MIYEVIILATTLASLALAIFALRSAIDAKVEVEAQKRTTHTIQYVPADELKNFSIDKPDGGFLTDDQKKALTKDPFEAL